MDFPVSTVIPYLHPDDTSARGIARFLVDNMSGVVESGILDADELSQVGGQLPVFEGVQPFGAKIGNVTLSASPTADRQHIFQNKDGVVALLDDAYRVRPTVVVPEGLVSVDWSTGKEFLCTLSGNRQSTFYMFNSQAGMEIDLLLVNNGTNQTVYAWDPLIKWPAGSPLAMPAATVGAAALMGVNLVNVNGIIYGEATSYAGGSFGTPPKGITLSTP